jgi:hypothetical protein
VVKNRQLLRKGQGNNPLIRPFRKSPAIRLLEQWPEKISQLRGLARVNKVRVFFKHPINHDTAQGIVMPEFDLPWLSLAWNQQVDKKR